MLKTYLMLTADRSRGQWKLNHDPENEFPIAELYEPSFVERMVDITDLDPQPEEGWLWDGNKFSPPPPPSIEELMVRLQNNLHSYVYSHYDPGTQASLTAIAAASLAILLHPNSTDADKTTALARLAQITTAWMWIQAVLTYYYELKGRLIAGHSWEDLAIDWQQFDGGDPQVALQTFVKGNT